MLGYMHEEIEKKRTWKRTRKWEGEQSLVLGDKIEQEIPIIIKSERRGVAYHALSLWANFKLIFALKEEHSSII